LTTDDPDQKVKRHIVSKKITKRPGITPNELTLHDYQYMLGGNGLTGNGRERVTTGWLVRFENDQSGPKGNDTL
jgi:hypothetical protein